MPRGVKVKERDTAGPPAVSTPYVCGPLGPTTLLVARNVATSLVVLDEPVFCRAKLTVTCSAGSMPPLVQLSLSSVVPLITNCDGTMLSVALELLFARLGSGTLLETVARLV